MLVCGLAGIAGFGAASRLTPNAPFRLTAGAVAYVGMQMAHGKYEESKFATEEGRKKY